MIDALRYFIDGRRGLPHSPTAVGESQQENCREPIPVEDLGSEQQHQDRRAAGDTKGRDEVNPAELRNNTAAATVQQIYKYVRNDSIMTLFAVRKWRYASCQFDFGCRIAGGRAPSRHEARAKGSGQAEASGKNDGRDGLRFS